MTATRCVGVLLVLFLAASLATAAEPRKTRIFNQPVETVWTAAFDVAKDAFTLSEAYRESGKLRFRTGPFRGYRFDVTVVSVAPGKTRVDITLYTNFQLVEKHAWKMGDRYLAMLTQRLQRGS